MKKYFFLAFAIFSAASLSQAQYKYDPSFPNNTKADSVLMAVGSGVSSVAVGLDGNVWTVNYNTYIRGDSLPEQGTGVAKAVLPLRIWKPDGTPVSFSPLMILKGGSVADTLFKGGIFGGTQGGNARGLTAAADGNILYVWGNNVYLLDYRTGAVLTKIVLDHRMGGAAAASSDLAGNIFAGPLFPTDGPVEMFDRSGAKQGNVTDTTFYFSRTLTCSRAGDKVYYAGWTAHCVICYTGNVSSGFSADSVLKGFSCESIARSGNTDLLWASAGSGNDWPNGYPGLVTNYSPHTWYLWDPSTNAIKDSIVWNGSNSFTYDDKVALRPRGIGPSMTGDTVYVSMFGAKAGMYSVQRFIRQRSLTVVPTNEWVSIWSDSSYIGGKRLAVGDVVDAFDPQGVRCGTFTVTFPGRYGLMPVYRDDAYTTEDEGAQPGDTLHFTINGKPASILGAAKAVWTAHGAVMKLNVNSGISPLPPSAPVALPAGGISPAQFTANWNADSMATSYQLDVSTAADFSGFVPGYHAKDAGASLSAVVTGLTARTKYYYRVRGFNVAGGGAYSNTVSVTTGQILVPTNEWVSFYGDSVISSGKLARVGSVVRAYDPSGTLCGEYTVATAGKYGLMAVYRDDASTAQDEGAQPGDTLDFSIDGMPARAWGPVTPIWTENGAIVKMNLTDKPVLAAAHETIEMPEVRVGDSTSVTVKFAAHTSAPVRIAAMSNSSPTFIVKADMPLTILPGSDTVVTVRFKPDRFGTFSDTLTAVSDGGTVRIILLAASPYPLMDASPSTLFFGNLRFVWNAQKTIMFKNKSINTLRIDSLRTGTRQFAAGECSSPVFITRTDSLVLALSFTPDTIRTFRDTLFVYTNQQQSVAAIPLLAMGDIPDRVSQNDGPLPQQYVLHQNYPNPFNPSTTLRYGLPMKSWVRLHIYDVLGRQVAELVNGEQSAGEQSVQWNADVTSGIYFYRIEAVSQSDPSHRFIDVKSMILMR